MPCIFQCHGTCATPFSLKAHHLCLQYAELSGAEPQVTYRLEMDPWGPGHHPITFQTCDQVDEILIVLRFIIKHNLKISGILTITYYKTTT